MRRKKLLLIDRTVSLGPSWNCHTGPVLPIELPIPDVLDLDEQDTDGEDPVKIVPVEEDGDDTDQAQSEIIDQSHMN